MLAWRWCGHFPGKIVMFSRQLLSLACTGAPIGTRNGAVAVHGR